MSTIPIRFITRLVLSLAILIAGLSPAAPAHAAGVVGDGTPASCTEAAFTAALLGGGTVTFNCGGPKTILVLNEQAIMQDTVIQGGGVITITGGLTTRLFRVFAPASLTLNDITLDSMYSPSTDGGAILSTGTLSLNNVTIQNSQAGNSVCGGAIRTDGVATISNSRFKNNIAGYGGGAICTAGFGAPTLQITNSSFDNNRATRTDIDTGFGGAIYLNTTANLTVVGSSFTSNSAQFGGALSVMQGATATLRTQNTVSTTYFAINSATDTGGAIYSQGSLSIYGVQFNGNTVPQNTLAVGYGGGVASLGALTLYDSFFSVNRGRFGGGLFVGGSATNARADVQRTIFSQNQSGSLGGGLYTNVDTTVITVTNSVFRRNTAVSGGGIARFNAQLRVLNSSITQNTATSGGGLYVGAGPSPSTGGYVQVRSVTFSGNEANSNQGGGVFNTGLLELYFTTIVSNPNGVYSIGGGNTRFRSSVLHNPGSLNCDGDGSAQLINDAANHVSDNSCGPQFTAAGDPKLGPLQDEGPTIPSYHLPLAGSPLINMGYGNCPERDQRGALRPDACDIGAVEFGGLLPRVYLPLVIR
jgi:predicted outer membrane repeat protein